MPVSVRTTIVLPEDKLKLLKKLAFEKGSSIGKLINQAIDQVFLGRKKRSFRSLRGIWKGLDISDRQIAEARVKLKEFPL